MLNVSIEKTETKSLKGTSDKTNKPYSFQIQEAWIWTLDPETKQQAKYPQKIELMLDETQQPYQVGRYILDASSIYVSRQGRLNVSPHLVPAKPAA